MVNLKNAGTIREEEIFRSEIQKKLALQFPKKWSARLWKFFNSGIVLTLVGTLVATVFFDHLLKES